MAFLFLRCGVGSDAPNLAYNFRLLQSSFHVKSSESSSSYTTCHNDRPSSIENSTTFPKYKVGGSPKYLQTRAPTALSRSAGVDGNTFKLNVPDSDDFRFLEVDGFDCMLFLPMLPANVSKTELPCFGADKGAATAGRGLSSVD